MPSVLLFSLIVVALVGIALAFLLPTLMGARGRRREASRSEINSGIYQQELAELEGEAARGEIPASDVQPAREELHRRLVDEIRSSVAAAPPRHRARLIGAALALAVPCAAIVLYLVVGRPDALDEEAAPAPSVQGDYVGQLQKHLSRQPRDGRGWVLLARAQAERNEFKAAADAYQKALTVSEKVARDPGVLCEYADVLGMTQGGDLKGKPAELIDQALTINPTHPVALEMAGSAAYAEGRYAAAATYWKELLAGLTPGSERYAQLSSAVARAERKAAVSLPR